MATQVINPEVTADVALGCTDQHHSRVALSDLVTRYLVPSFDCGVMLEGQLGKITGQIVQIIRFLSADACALCRNLVVPARLVQELMSPDERTTRRGAAAEAPDRGR